MWWIRSGVVVVVLSCLISFEAAAADPVRVAVLWTPALEDHGVLLETALSQQDDLTVLDRANLKDLFREFSIDRNGTGGGNKGLERLRVLDADGVLILEEMKAGDAANAPPRIAVRLATAETGAVVAAFLSPGGLEFEATGESAAVIANRFLAPLRNLRDGLETSVPISILNIRPEGLSPSPESIRLQKEIEVLLGHRIAAEPGIFTLERRRLADLDFEKLFSATQSQEFWTGAWLLDGGVREGEEKDEFTLVIRLISATGDSDKSWEFPVSAAAGSAAAVLDSVVARVAEQVRQNGGAGPDKNPSRWNREREADAFLREADWALSIGYFGEAESAARASFALGEETRDLAFRLLIKAETTRMHDLKPYQARDDTAEPDYSEYIRTGIDLLRNLQIQIEGSSDPNDTLLLATEGAESARQVLFACWRRNAFQYPEVAGELTEFRSAFRDFWKAIDPVVGKLKLHERRMSKLVPRLEEHKGAILGLCFDRRADALAHWQEVLSRDPHLTPRPRPTYLTAAGFDWSGPWTDDQVLHSWRILCEWLDASGDPHLRLKGWIIRNKLGTNFDLRASRDQAFRRKLASDPAYTWLAGTRPEEAFEILRANRERFLEDADHDYYLVPLFYLAKKLPRDKEGDWTTADGPFFAAFCTDLLKHCDSAHPLLTEFLLGTRNIRRHLPSTNLNGFQLPRAEKIAFAEAYHEYEKGLSRFMPREHVAIIFKFERFTIRREALLDSEVPEETNPLGRLALGPSLRAGLPAPVGQSSGIRTAFDRAPTGPVFHSVQIAYGSNKAGRPRGEVRLFRLNLRDGSETVTNFGKSAEFSKDGKIFMPMYCCRTSRSTVLTGHRYWPDPQTGKSRTENTLMDLDDKTGRITVARLGTAAGNLKVVPGGDETVYLSAGGSLSNPLSMRSHRGQNLVLLQTWNAETKELTTYSNSARRPARNFLDDRPPYLGNYFGPGLENRPVIGARFAMRRDGGARTSNLFVWDERSSEWRSSTLPAFDGQWLNRIHNTSGFALAGNRSGDYDLFSGGELTAFLGTGEEAVFLRPPDSYRDEPVAYTRTTQRLIERDQVAMLPDGSLYYLMVRRTRSGQEEPLLRCWHPETGRTHYDLVLDLQVPPEVDLSYTSKNDRNGPEGFYPYLWKLRTDGENLALYFANGIQANLIPIPGKEIEERLKTLHARRAELTRFETLSDADLAEMEADQVRTGRIARAILAEDTAILKEQIEQGELTQDTELGPIGLFPLHYAVYHGKPESAALILGEGADPNAMSPNVPALNLAIRGRNRDCIRLLLAAEGIEIDKNVHGFSLPILHEALMTRDDAVFDLVWEHLGRDDLQQALENARKTAWRWGKLESYEEAGERLARLEQESD